MILESIDFRELYGFVKCDFYLGSLELECRVPSAPIRAVEAAAKRMRVGESSVNNARIRNAEYEGVKADLGQSIVLAKQTVVGGVIQIEDVSEMRIIISDPPQDTAGVLAVLRRNQPV